MNLHLAFLDALKQDLSDTSRAINDFIAKNDKLKQSIASVKAVGKTAFHGALGPGLYASDFVGGVAGGQGVRKIVL